MLLSVHLMISAYSVNINNLTASILTELQLFYGSGDNYPGRSIYRYLSLYRIHPRFFNPHDPFDGCIEEIHSGLVRFTLESDKMCHALTGVSAFNAKYLRQSFIHRCIDDARASGADPSHAQTISLAGTPIFLGNGEPDVGQSAGVDRTQSRITLVDAFCCDRRSP